MPWSLDRRTEGWCVVKEADGTVAGCHDSRADAIRQQRALYANEARVASMYAELDARPDPEPEVVAAPSSMSAVQAEIMALLLREEKERSLVASVAESQSLISRQFEEAAAERQALVAALNVHVPQSEVNVHVPPAEVSVNVPAAQVTVQPADVVVNLPERQKTVTFERDPLTNQVTSAEVTEA